MNLTIYLVVWPALILWMVLVDSPQFKRKICHRCRSLLIEKKNYCTQSKFFCISLWLILQCSTWFFDGFATKQLGFLVTQCFTLAKTLPHRPFVFRRAILRHPQGEERFIKTLPILWLCFLGIWAENLWKQTVCSKVIGVPIRGFFNVIWFDWFGCNGRQ